MQKMFKTSLTMVLVAMLLAFLQKPFREWLEFYSWPQVTCLLCIASLKKGGFCIATKVQSGFARTGSHFWEFEAHAVVPDIATMAKGIGNGVPIGAVVTTPEIVRVLTYRTYFNTSGGNPVSTTSGLAVLRVIEKEKLQENARVVDSWINSDHIEMYIECAAKGNVLEPEGMIKIKFRIKELLDYMGKLDQ